MLKRQFLAFLLILSFVTPFFYLPYQAKKAEAFLGFGDLVIDVKALVERIIDGIAMTAAQIVVDRMIQATVKWAQTGFEGNPSYVTDTQQFFTDIADGVAGEFIMKDEHLGFLCSPFQANIRLSLAQQYYSPRQFQCTITGIKGNLDDFIGDFSQGGWDTWFEVTQNPMNNPYGAYLEAKMEMDTRIAAAAGKQREELNWNQGFMSWSRCVETNPPAWIDSPSQVEVGRVSNPATGGNLSSSNFTATGQTLPSRIPNPKHVPGKAVGECIQRGKTETPGSTVKAQLDRVLPSGLEKLISVEHVEQLINAFASGLLQRFVFGPKGIFARDNRAAASTGTGVSDIDGDGTPDGMDSNGDGTLDVCYFGGADGNPNGKPCLGSIRAGQTQAPTGGGGEDGVVTGWAWDDHGGPPFQSSRCPDINPRDHFNSLIVGRNASDWKAVMGEIESGLWSCGIGHQKTSDGEARGRLFLPTAACPDASPDASEASLGVKQNPACWTHEVDVLEITAVSNPPVENFSP
jgi:hypothetical protein